MMHVVEDTARISHIREGNHTAFTEAYYAHHKQVFYFLLKRVKIAEVAQDLTQECFIRLWDYRENLSLEHSLTKQIFITSRSLLINYLKKDAVVKHKHLTYSLHNQKQMEVVDTTTASNVFEIKNYVHHLMAELSPTRKKILYLKVDCGYSNKEIANELSISLKTVEDHISKAYNKLRQTDVHPYVLLLLLFIN